LNEGVNGCKQKQQDRTDSMKGVVDALVALRRLKCSRMVTCCLT